MHIAWQLHRVSVLSAGLAMTWLLLFGVAPAAANHHLMKIKEVFAGTSGQPAAQFVELQMHAANQTVQTGKQLIVYDASGAAIATYTFAANSAVGTNQSTVLIATPQAARFLRVTPNLTIEPVIRPAGGKVCTSVPRRWRSGGVACRWGGGYSGSSVGTGAPFNPAGGLVSGQSALRDISGGLDPRCSRRPMTPATAPADFDLALPTPRTNAGATTSTEGRVAVCGRLARLHGRRGRRGQQRHVERPGARPLHRERQPARR